MLSKSPNTPMTNTHGSDKSPCDYRGQTHGTATYLNTPIGTPSVAVRCVSVTYVLEPAQLNTVSDVRLRVYTFYMYAQVVLSNIVHGGAANMSRGQKSEVCLGVAGNRWYAIPCCLCYKYSTTNAWSCAQLLVHTKGDRIKRT